MPLDDFNISKEVDGTWNEDYCKWCYENGKFTYSNMDDLIAYCSENMSNESFSSEEIRAYMKRLLPTLNHWK